MHLDESAEESTEHIIHFYSDTYAESDKVAVIWHSVNDPSSGNSLIPRGKTSVHRSPPRRRMHLDEPPTPTNVTLLVYFDSQQAVNACGKHNSRIRTVNFKVKAKVLGCCNCDVTIYWIPGHQGIPDNKTAHDAE